MKALNTFFYFNRLLISNCNFSIFGRSIELTLVGNFYAIDYEFLFLGELSFCEVLPNVEFFLS